MEPSLVMAEVHHAEEQPLLSVVIPVHNAASLQPDLRRSIRQWLLLPSPGVQVIVVLDGPSEDLRWLALEPEEMSSGRLEVTRSVVCQGPGAARNEGIIRSTGETIYFMDADDTVDAAAISEISAMLLATQYDVAVFGYKVHDFRTSTVTNRVCLPKTKLPALEPALTRDAAVWRFVFRASFLREHGLRFPALCMGEDLIFLLQAAGKRPAVLPVPIVAYEHFMRLGSLSNARRVPADRYRKLLSLLATGVLLGRTSARTKMIALLWLARISRRFTVSRWATSTTLELDEK
jgi:glycosyltransferase involved in cell wall biosynthesis